MPVIFVHIGMQKTATTSLQTICSYNRQRLLNENILYPALQLQNPVQRHSINHRLIAQRWLSALNAGYSATCSHYWREHLLPQFRQFPAANVLLSAEMLWDIRPEKASDERMRTMLTAFAGYQPKIVVYLRRQDWWLESMYNQRVKNGFESRPIRAFVKDELEAGSADIHKKLTYWQTHFGRGNLTVRIFEPDRFIAGNVIDDFFTQIGLTDFDALRIRMRKNTRLRPELIKAKASLNPYIKWNVLRRFVRMCFLSVQKIMPAGKQRLLPYELAVKIMERYDDGNRRVAKEFLGRKEDFLFSSLPHNETKWQHYPT